MFVIILITITRIKRAQTIPEKVIKEVLNLTDLKLQNFYPFFNSNNKLLKKKLRKHDREENFGIKNVVFLNLNFFRQNTIFQKKLNKFCFCWFVRSMFKLN